MLYLYRQMRRDYKIKFTDKLKANLWIHLDLAKGHRLKGLASRYIVFYLHFLNLNNILTPNFCRRWSRVWFDTTYVCLVFCQPDLHARTLVYEIKTNANRQLLYGKNWTTAWCIYQVLTITTLPVLILYYSLCNKTWYIYIYYIYLYMYIDR